MGEGEQQKFWGSHNLSPGFPSFPFGVPITHVWGCGHLGQEDKGFVLQPQLLLERGLDAAPHTRTPPHPSHPAGPGLKPVPAGSQGCHGPGCGAGDPGGVLARRGNPH